MRSIALLAAAACLAPLAATACQVDRFNFTWGSDVSIHMAAKPAEGCKFGFKYNPRGHLAGVQVVQPPQHGSVTAADATHWVYKASPGYAGPDAIVVKASGEMVGNRRTSSGETNFSYDVTVAP